MNTMISCDHQTVAVYEFDSKVVRVSFQGKTYSRFFIGVKCPNCGDIPVVSCFESREEADAFFAEYF